MKKEKFVSFVTFLCALISIPVLFFILSTTVNVSIFGMGEIIYYSWVYYFAIVFCALSFAAGVSLRKKGVPHYTKNFVIAALVVPLAINLGSFRFIFSDYFDYSDAFVRSAEAKTSIILPGKVKVVTDKTSGYFVGNVVIEDVSQKEAFEKTIQEPIWVSSLSAPIEVPWMITSLICLLPATILYFLIATAVNTMLYRVPREVMTAFLLVIKKKIRGFSLSITTPTRFRTTFRMIPLYLKLLFKINRYGFLLVSINRAQTNTLSRLSF